VTGEGFVADRNGKKTAMQILRYIVVGGASALIELLLFLGCYEFMHIAIAYSNVIALVSSTVVNFSLNRQWSFKSSSNLVGSMVKYGILFIFNLGFSTVVVIWLVGFGLPSVFAKAMTMACVVCWNFVLYRKVIFK
jgi:putative flippase GtrA